MVIDTGTQIHTSWGNMTGLDGTPIWTKVTACLTHLLASNVKFKTQLPALRKPMANQVCNTPSAALLNPDVSCSFKRATYAVQTSDQELRARSFLDTRSRPSYRPVRDARSSLPLGIPVLSDVIGFSTLMNYSRSDL